MILAKRLVLPRNFLYRVHLSADKDQDTGGQGQDAQDDSWDRERHNQAQSN